jgi:hypothetical protein
MEWSHARLTLFVTSNAMRKYALVGGSDFGSAHIQRASVNLYGSGARVSAPPSARTVDEQTAKSAINGDAKFAIFTDNPFYFFQRTIITVPTG